MEKIKQKKIKPVVYKRKVKEKKEFSLFSQFDWKLKIYFLIIFFLTIFTILGDVIVKIMLLSSENESFTDITKGVIYNLFFYFTKETMIFILIILSTFFWKIKNKKKYSIFIYASIISSLLTLIVFNTCLSPFWTEKWIFDFSYFAEKFGSFARIKYFINFIEHLVIPFSYFVFFLFFISPKIYLKKFLYTFAHPLIYVSFWFCIMYFDLLDTPHDCDKLCKLPYCNIQCDKSTKSLFGSTIFGFKGKGAVGIRLLILVAIFAMFFCLIFFLKQWIDKKKFTSRQCI